MPAPITSLLAGLAAATTFAQVANAHIALWHPSMFGWDPTDGNQQEPVNPLYNLPYDQWWMHGYKSKPPASGMFMELPAGGTFRGQVGCNKAWTTYGANPDQWNATWACDGAAPTHGLGAMHTSDTWEDPAPHDVKGCALAIAYTSDENAVTPEEMTVFSVNYTCPWKRDVDFQVPADLPACPPGGCICTWNWIHSDDAGSEQIYNLAYRCEVTGASNTRSLTKTPVLPNKCPTDKSNCTVGPKVPFYWLQAERNNIFQDYYDPPFYNGDYGFANGAQNDLFVNVASSPSSTTSAKSSTAISSSTAKTSSIPSAASSTKTSASSSTVKTSTAASSSSSTKISSSISSTKSSASSLSTKTSVSSSTKTSASSSTKTSSSTTTRATSTSASSSALTKTSSATPAPSATASASSISGYTYSGCISDGDSRALSDGPFMQTETMTLEQCAARCVGWKYFGVEYGTQCYCGNTLNYRGDLDASQCKMPCSGNGGETCGGSWALSLYVNSASGSSSSGGSSCSPATVTKTVTVTANAGAPTRRSMWGKSRTPSLRKLTDAEREARRKAWDAEAERESKVF